MKPDAVARAERILGNEAENWARVVSRGYSVNEHWTAGFADGSRAFLKLASVDPSPQWVRDERHVFECVSGPFMPRFLGFEDGEKPLLILEDMLPDARWPPPWHPGDVDFVLAALAEVASAPLSGELAPLAEERGTDGWHVVAADPEPFLSLGIVSADWLERSLPALLDASDKTPFDGGSLVHCDVRSDNLCLRSDRAVLLDWNHARIGNPAFDLAFWLPSLVLEGGPGPEGFHVDEFAAFVAGFFASSAGLPAPAGAPRVRAFQRAQLEVALPWASAALGLQPL